MADTSTESNPERPPTEFLGLSDMAHRLFGSSSRSAKARVVRMADRGELAAIRIGRRGDRLFPASEIGRLHSEASDPTGTEGDIMNRDQYATSAEFVGYAKHDAEGNLTVGSSDGTVTLNLASTTPRAAGNSWWQDRKVCVYVRRSVLDLSVIEVHMVCDARLAHEEAEEQRKQAEQYPLGSKQYWRGALVGKAVDLTGERVMTDEDFDAEWTGDPDTLDWILDR